MPGSEPDPTRPDVPDEEPTLPGVVPEAAPEKWSGSAAVPPPTGKKRRRWLATTREDDPPPRDPTLQLPPGERHALEVGAPVDPWADADPLDTPYPPTLLEPPPASPPPPLRTPSRALPPVPQALPPAPQARPVPPPPRPPVRPRALPPAPVTPPYARPPAPPRLAGPPVAPPGYAPPRVRRRRRRWPWLLLLTVACCCGCPAWFGKPMWDQYPASATLPAEVSDLRLRDDNASRQVADRLVADMRAAHWLADDTFAGVYGDRAGKRVTVFGTTGFRFSPDDDLRGELDRLTDRYRIRELEKIDTGTRGEYLSCGVGRDGDATVAVCGWADHGSLATAVFTRRSRTDSAELIQQLRTTIITRE